MQVIISLNWRKLFLTSNRCRNELLVKRRKTNKLAIWSRTEIVKLIRDQLVEIVRLLIQRIDQDQLIGRDNWSNRKSCRVNVGTASLNKKLLLTWLHVLDIKSLKFYVVSVVLRLSSGMIFRWPVSVYWKFKLLTSILIRVSEIILYQSYTMIGWTNSSLCRILIDHWTLLSTQWFLFESTNSN